MEQPSVEMINCLADNCWVSSVNMGLLHLLETLYEDFVHQSGKLRCVACFTELLVVFYLVYLFVEV